MANLIRHKRSSTAGAAPSTSALVLGEIAVNTYDGALFLKKNDGTDTVLTFRDDSYFIPLSQKAATNGVASLGSDGKVPSSQLPSGLAYVVGEYKMAAPSSLGTGWLLCNGAAVSRTTYASLFAAIGTSFGAGDGSTTFNLPDPRGRAVGISGQGSGLTNRTAGTSVGTETHTLSKAELPTHAHTYTRANMGTVGAGVGSEAAATSVTTNVATGNGSADGLSGLAHNNMPPTLYIGNLFIYAGV